MPRKLILLVAASTFLGSLPMFATGPSFHPDRLAYLRPGGVERREWRGSRHS
jgi:hypothetical protein